MSLRSNTPLRPARRAGRARLQPKPDRRFIDTAELTRHAAHVGRDYRTRGVQDSAPLEGEFGVDTLPGGLVLRRAHVRNREDMSCQVDLCPGVKLVLVLEGDVDVRFGDRALPRAAHGGHRGYAVHLREHTTFERRAQRGTRERSLTLTLPHEWLRQRLVMMGDGRAGPTMIDAEHLCMQPWRPSAALCAQAESLFAPNAPEAGPARRLHAESLALAMVAEAMPVLLDAPARTEPPRPIDSRRMRRMRDLVDQPPSTPLSVEELAREAGMSRSSLQRHFKTCYGMSVQRFLRERRLQAADRALRERKISVIDAAEIAGYTSPANFATAFRRVFGMTPRDARRQAGQAQPA